MTRKAVALLLFVALCAASASTSNPQAHHKPPKPASTSQQEFNPPCANPSFPSPTATSIDSLCGLDGIGVEKTQNEAKNNFCASGNPEVMKINQFTALQKQAASTKGVTFGEKTPTLNRAPLQSLGEGKLVTFQGYVLNARQEEAETVNCGKPPQTQVPNTPSNHDIHISLGESKGDSECSGIVAEMIPHHRPTAWSADNVLKVKNASLPVHVTGQLMFDSSHVPCQGSSPVGKNPARVSLWEVHPIYKFEVCTSGCQGAGQWESLEQWLQTH